MTQSLGISVLLRAHALAGNPAYLVGATGALEWMRRPVASGGVAMRAEKGVWYEEYPSIERPSHVLNGHIWALFGIWDYFRETRDPEVAAMFREGATALLNEIDRYDVGYWVVYDQLNRVDMINGYYLDFVVEQLRVLHAITGEEALARTALRWQRYMRDRSLFGHMAFEEHAKTMHMPRAKSQPTR